MASASKCLQCCTMFVVKSTESFFYNLGYKIGSSPKRTILFCWIFVFVTALGFLRFHQEKNPLKLWVPPNSKFLHDSEWLMHTYQKAYRAEDVQLVADDVLTPEVLMQLLDIHDNVTELTKTNNNITWTNVCFRIPKVDKGLLRILGSPRKDEKDPSITMNAAIFCSFVEAMEEECFEKSVLGLWDFDRDVISRLTKDDIVYAINKYDRDAIFNSLKNYEDLLGGIVHNQSGHIVAAKSLLNQFMVFVDFTKVNMDDSGNHAGTADWASLDALNWEKAFLETMNQVRVIDNISVYYEAARSFGDISNATLFQDIGILCIGVFIMVIYVQFVISKFNWLEARVTLGSLGLLTVGMSFVSGCGLCSLLGISYGPVHTSLPFLLMGLGIDDMFVIMACWDDLDEEERKLPTPERIGLVLKHGGVSITVTTVTDVLAFIVGSSSILPSLESYCIYAAVCVMMTFIFAVTFFTACFVLDQRRVENKCNGIVICYQHSANYTANECSQRQTSNRLFHFVYDRFVLTKPGKIIVLLIAAVSLGFSIESVFKLKQLFDPMWFIPEKTYLYERIQARNEFFPTMGFEAGLYVGAVNYTQELQTIRKMVEDLKEQSDIALDVVSWVEPFRDYVLVNFGTDIYEETLNEDRFATYLSLFLFSPRSAIYQGNFQFEKPLECGVPTPKIVISSINFRLNRFTTPEEYLPAMHTILDIASNANLTTGSKFATAWSKIFATWITNEIIDIEVLRNLQLALICVMACTMLLIVDLQTCFWIFICVLMTMINVCGFMERWGLTIDLVSCIGLELAIGLCVDYATHIGHTFMTKKEGDRRTRILSTVTSIGSAVLYGGLSTLIGVFMLSQSDSYIFQSFFKIFFLVIIFGLFHGVVFLPVILSWIGPKPYKHGDIIRQNDIEIK